jgi:hypothetical protein
MPKIFHAIAIATAIGAGSLVLSASPSLACYVSASACHETPTPGAEAPAPVAHRGARLYNVVPGGSTTSSLRPSAPYRSPQRGPALWRSK